MAAQRAYDIVWSKPMKYLIDVKDRRNPERLLGRLWFRPTMEVHEGMAVHTSLPPATFQIAYRSENNGFAQVAELHTDAPLGVLMMMFGFVLPAETSAEANERRCRSSLYDRYDIV